MQQSEYLFILMRFLRNTVADTSDNQEDYSWITTCQNYYDDRKRTLIVEEDLFGIIWEGKVTEYLTNELGNLYEKEHKEIFKSLALAYTTDGFRPLHGYWANGALAVDLDGVLKAWAEVIMKQLIIMFLRLLGKTGSRLKLICS